MSDVPRDPSAEPTGYGGTGIPKSAANWAMMCHLASLAGCFGPGVFHVVGPLIVWLLKKDEHPFIDEQGKESLNFQISMVLYALLVSPLICVVIGIFLLIGLAIADVVLVIIAAIKVGDGINYRYPMTIRFLK